MNNKYKSIFFAWSNSDESNTIEEAIKSIIIENKNVVFKNTVHSNQRINERHIDEVEIQNCINHGKQTIKNDKLIQENEDIKVIRSLANKKIITAYRKFNSQPDRIQEGKIIDQNKESGIGFIKTTKNGSVAFILEQNMISLIKKYTDRLLMNWHVKFEVVENEIGQNAINIERIDDQIEKFSHKYFKNKQPCIFRDNIDKFGKKSQGNTVTRYNAKRHIQNIIIEKQGSIHMQENLFTIIDNFFEGKDRLDNVQFKKIIKLLLFEQKKFIQEGRSMFFANHGQILYGQVSVQNQEIGEGQLTSDKGDIKFKINKKYLKLIKKSMENQDMINWKVKFEVAFANKNISGNGQFAIILEIEDYHDTQIKQLFKDNLFEMFIGQRKSQIEDKTII